VSCILLGGRILCYLREHSTILEIMDKPKRTLNKQEGELFQRAVAFTISVADKYKDDRAYEAALVGLYVGLKAYTDNEHTFNLETYLHWFVKTSIEYELGYKNKDTKIWGEKKESAGEK